MQKPFRKLNTRDGLPQSFISGLVQDKDDFIWISTRNGLVRYDGIHFKLFQHNSRDTTSLSSNLIISLALDRRNHLYIEHEASSLDQLDAATGLLERVTARPLFRSRPVKFLRRGWLFDKAGNLWCTTYGNGLYYYQWQQNKASHFSTQLHQLPSDTIFGMLQDNQGQLWVTGTRSIARFDSANNRFINIPFPEAYHYTLADSSGTDVTAMLQRRNGEIMLSDCRQLIFFQPQTNRFRSVPLPETLKTPIHWIQTGPDGREYFEANGLVYRYDEAGGLAAIGDINLATFRNATSFLVDRSGLIWLGTNAAGIHQIDIKAPSFESHPGEVPFHYYLLQNEWGIALDQFAGWPKTDHNFNLSSYFFRSEYGPNGRLYCGLRDKVGYYDPQLQKLVTLPTVPGIGNPEIRSWGLRGISFDPDGVLWVVGDRGYIGYFDPEKQQWQTFLEATVLQKKFKLTISLFDLLVDQEYIWISSGTGEGLIRIHRKTRRIEAFNQETTPGLLSTNLLLQLQTDPVNPDRLWIGSYEGLISLDKKTRKTAFYSIEHGLPDNTIYSILPDNDGYLWLSTNQGLCRFHPITHQVQVFKAESGLPGNEFNRFNHLKMPDGRMAFGGMDGWVLFNPHDVKADTYEPQIAFTGIRFYNEQLSDSISGTLLPQPLNDLHHLELSANQNTVSFEFAGLEYNQPHELRYRYQLEGYDDQWTETDNPVAAYTKLPPGNYVLHINCTNTTGQWSQHIRKLEITVLPPWWRTGWAYASYLLLAGTIIYFLYRTWLDRQKARQQLFLQRKEAEQLKAMDDMKTRFFSNITHEFRTPLTLIIAPLDHIIRNEQAAPLQKQLNGIQNNARQLLYLVNQVLDMAKLEADSMKVSLYQGIPGDFVEQQVQTFSPAAAARNIRLHFQEGTSCEAYLFDADKLHTIFFNLLSNAIKFTRPGGHIAVILEEGRSDPPTHRTDFFFRVKDDGIGIPIDQQALIFKRFYQVPPDNRQPDSGTGIGLALAKELAELMQGTLSVSGQPGEGSIFTLQLPLQKANGVNAPEYRPVNEMLPVLPDTSGDELLTETGEDVGRPLILVVEDNPELNDFIARTFRKDYRVLTAMDGKAGLKTAQEYLPDLIISDWMMPGMDGLALCREIKKNIATSHIAFVQLTARAAPGSRLEGLQSGADEYLTKPFITGELQMRVSNLLERQQRIREKLQKELTQVSLSHEMMEAKPERTDHPFLNQLYVLVEAHLDDTGFGVEEIAAGVGMSRANLHRKLKAIADLTPGSIIRNYRLQRAAQYLKDGFNSSETAYKTGFETPAYFTKCFRDFFGVTPTDYLKKG